MFGLSKKWGRWLLCVPLWVGMAPSVQAAPPKTVALFLPRERGDSFWDLLSDFMAAACQDLGLKLRLYYAKNDPVLAKIQMQDATTGPHKVDGLVFQNFEETGPELLKIAEKNRVPALVIDTGIDGVARQKWGKPRQHLHFWLGEFIPDNEEAGYDLANYLIEQARQKGLHDSLGRVHLVGLSGTHLSHASIDRVKGLKIAVQNRDDVVLHHILPAYWKDTMAAQQFNYLWHLFPQQIHVGWGANDPMALGMLQAAQKSGLKPNQTFMAGGVDWTSDALKSILKGEMAASVGGHFMLGGWAAILMYDYFHGHDFAEESVDMRLRMDLLTKANIHQYASKFGSGNWQQIDFRRFSKAIRPGLQKYQFGLKALLQGR